MDYFSYERRLDYLAEEISKGRVRSLERTAARFGCSTRTLRRMLAHLRKRGLDVRYDPLLRKFHIHTAG